MTAGDGSHYCHDRDRLERNRRSKAWATKTRQPWSDADDMYILSHWLLVDPGERDEVAISKALERTIESCRGRAESLRAMLGITEHNRGKQEEKPYVGAQDDPDDQWWSPGYYTDK